LNDLKAKTDEQVEKNNKDYDLLVERIGELQSDQKLDLLLNEMIEGMKNAKDEL
jgi:hypothetical protein